MTKTSLPLSLNEMSLPDISSIRKSQQACGESFLRVGYILSQYLKHIESAVAALDDFKDDPFNWVALGLFSKLRCHYYSFVLLEVHRDQIGSQFLMEHLCETAITLTYLLEEADEEVFSEYIAASARQAHHILAKVDDKLQVSQHQGLLKLREKLESCIAQQQGQPTALATQSRAEAYSWGLPEVDTTTKRGATTGLGFLADPVRPLALSVVPASWLDLQINYSGSISGNAQANTESSPNFTSLRDTAHLCLHATRAFLEEVTNNYQRANLDIESLSNGLDILFEWFHSAHHAYRIYLAGPPEKLNFPR